MESNQKQVTCSNCRFNVTMIERRKGFKCPRCGSGKFEGWDIETYINQPNGGGRNLDVRGDKLAS